MTVPPHTPHTHYRRCGRGPL